ncbi:MAG: cytochrome P450 [Segniliparus sp.]|uniref:cytochrome P450 n=1 Tax=Segniliparus sp. TaxID=2804064 RepID=UPI003F2F5169
MDSRENALPKIPAAGPVNALRFLWDSARLSPGEALGGLQRRLGAPAVRCPLPFCDLVMCADPDLAQTIALNKEEAFSSAWGWGFTLSLLGMFRRSLLQMEFAEHRHDRLLMQQVMTPARLAEYSEQIGPKIRAGVRECPTGDDVDLRKLFKRITMRVAIEVFMGVRLPDAEVDKIGKGLDDIVSVNPVAQARARHYLQKTLLSWARVKRAVETPDLMSQLCHARALDGKAYTDKQVMRHMLFFLFAAHDTTTITMTNMAYYIGRNRHWQDRARAEALALPEVVEVSELDRMPELDRIMKETLRFRTPVLTLLRTTVKNTTLGGYRVPKWTLFSVLTWAHHTDPEVWSNPRRFDPDRFSPERAEDKSHRCKWMPFGAGVHKCIGMHFAKLEVFTLYHALLREFAWSVDENHVLSTFRNSLVFSNGFPAKVRRLDPAVEPETTPADDREVEWGVFPNLGNRLFHKSPA